MHVAALGQLIVIALLGHLSGLLIGVALYRGEIDLRRLRAPVRLPSFAISRSGRRRGRAFVMMSELLVRVVATVAVVGTIACIGAVVWYLAVE